MAKLKLYCQQCGSSHEYTLEKPRFCQKCGNGFGNTSSFSKEKTITEEIPQEEESKEESFNFEKIKKLEVNLIINKPGGETIGNILSQPRINSEYIDDFKEQRIPKAKEVLEEFKREAGSLRKKDGTRT